MGQFGAIAVAAVEFLLAVLAIEKNASLATVGLVAGVIVCAFAVALAVLPGLCLDDDAAVLKILRIVGACVFVVGAGVSACYFEGAIISTVVLEHVKGWACINFAAVGVGAIWACWYFLIDRTLTEEENADRNARARDKLVNDRRPGGF